MPRLDETDLDEQDLYDPDLELDEDGNPIEEDDADDEDDDFDVFGGDTKKKTKKKTAKKKTTKKTTKKAAPKKAAPKKKAARKTAAETTEEPEPKMALPHTPPQPPPSAAPPEPATPVFSDQAPWGRGPSPLELGASPASAVIEVERLKAYNENTPGKNFDHGGTYTGPIGQVAHEPGFELEVRRQFGGGEYMCRGYVNGEVREKFVRIGLPSIDPDDDHDHDHDPLASVFGQPGRQNPYGDFAETADRRTFMQDPYLEPRPPFPPGGFGAERRSPYDDDFGPPRLRTPYGDMTPFQTRFGRGNESDELREARERLERLEREKLETEKRLEIEAIRRETDREIERARAAVNANASQAGKSEIAELMQMQLQLQQQRREEEAEKERRRYEREQAETKRRDEEERRRREEERERYERERKERLDKEERERKERLEKEERLERERKERDRQDRAWREQQAARQAQFQELMSQTMLNNASKPMDMIQVIAALKDVAAPPSDPMSQLHSMLGVVEQINDLKGGDGPEISQAERVIKTVGEVAGPILGEVAGALSARSQAAAQQQQAAPQPMTQEQWAAYQQQQHLLLQQQQAALAQQQQHPGLPQPSAQPAAQPQQAGAAQQPAEQQQNLTPAKWGRIMQHVVECQEAGKDPAQAVSEFFTLTQEIQAIPAIPELAAGTVDQAISKAKMAKLAVSDARYKIMIEKFVNLGEPGPKREWLEQFFAYTREGWEQATQAAEAAEGSQEETF